MPTIEHRFVSLAPGDPAPWFQAACTGNPEYRFDTVAGRYVVLCFFGSAAHAAGSAALNAVMSRRALFDYENMCFFGVSIDPLDRDSQRVRASLPGIRFFWDFDGAVSRSYGALAVDAALAGEAPFRQFWVILDPTLRVMRVFPLAATMAEQAPVFDYLESLPPPGVHTGSILQAPILLLPNVFEPNLCKKLIDYFEANGGSESAFMRPDGNRTVFANDREIKSRRDCHVRDQSLIDVILDRIRRRLVPEIRKVYQFEVTRMDRNLVCCYSAQEQGHFTVHRDNTAKGTEYRRFAASINLNSDFDGGEISFPEYGPQSFKPTEGAAVVFSCSLMHQVSKMTRGRRYAFLPFLYDDAGEALREQNKDFVDWTGEKR